MLTNQLMRLWASHRVWEHKLQRLAPSARVFNKSELIPESDQLEWSACSWASLVTQVESLCPPGWSRIPLNRPYQRF